MRKTFRARLPLAIACLSLSLPMGLAMPEGEPKETKAPAPPPKLHEVRRGPFKYQIQAESVIEAADMAAIKLAPKVWTDLTVVEALAHGARVAPGDRLVKFETEKLEEQIADLEQDRTLARLSQELGAADLANLREATPARLAAAQRSARIAAEELEYFDRTLRHQRQNNALFSVTNALWRLQNAQEELSQLEQMYKADHLTEETEEIIIKRQRFQVEAARFSLEGTERNTARELTVLLPRDADRLRNERRDQETALALAEATLPRTLARKELEIEKSSRDGAKSERRLEQLKQDLASLEVKAPIAGLVYYGACQQGRWNGGGDVARKLIPGGKVGSQEVFMTVVNTDRVVARIGVAEADLPYVVTGLSGEATAAVRPGQKLRAKVLEASLVPLAAGGFGAMVSLDNPDRLPLMPGMTCRVSFPNVEKPDTLAVPKGAVFSDNNEKVVYTMSEDGKALRRVVKTGASNEAQIEILDGLVDGDRITLTKPE